MPTMYNGILKEKWMLKLERVQRRATKLIPETSKNHAYSERFKILKLPTLKYRS